MNKIHYAKEIENNNYFNKHAHSKLGKTTSRTALQSGNNPWSTDIMNLDEKEEALNLKIICLINHGENRQMNDFNQLKNIVDNGTNIVEVDKIIKHTNFTSSNHQMNNYLFNTKL